LRLLIELFLVFYLFYVDRSSFVGLIAPHIARQLVGNSHQGLIPIAGTIGAAIVVIADFLGRILFAPVELPCGIITSVIGVPYFVYLLVRNRSKCN
jgi:iron complex transport system permease protein